MLLWRANDRSGVAISSEPPWNCARLSLQVDSPESHPYRVPDDGELLYRLSRGDEPAYRMLHERHQAAVFRVALVLVRTTWDAEEVAATAFFELWRKRDNVRVVDGSALPWLLATTSYAAKNSLRTRRRYQRLLNRIPREHDVPDHAEEVARAMEAFSISHESAPILAARLRSMRCR